MRKNMLSKIPYVFFVTHSGLYSPSTLRSLYQFFVPVLDLFFVASGHILVMIFIQKSKKERNSSSIAGLLPPANKRKEFTFVMTKLRCVRRTRWLDGEKYMPFFIQILIKKFSLHEFLIKIILKNVEKFSGCIEKLIVPKKKFWLCFVNVRGDKLYLQYKYTIINVWKAMNKYSLLFKSFK